MEKLKRYHEREDKITLCNDEGSMTLRIPNLEDIENSVSYVEDRKWPLNRGNIEPCSNLKQVNLRREYFKSITYCFLSVFIAFILGILIGIFLVNILNSVDTVPSSVVATNKNLTDSNVTKLSKTKTDYEDDVKKSDFKMVSFTGGGLFVAKENHKIHEKNVYPKGMSEDMKDILKDNKKGKQHRVERKMFNTYTPNENTVIFNNVFWGPLVENSLPDGYDQNSVEVWEKYVNRSEVIKMEVGCGRMQNRLVTFKDGIQACVRYRQNTDQIQGEIFSFYVGKLLNLTNLAPSVVKIVDSNDDLWKNVATEIGNSQWNNNRAVVLTQYVPSLESASIPDIFKPSNRHLNKFDILKMSLNENDTESKRVNEKFKKYEISKTEVDFFSHIDMNLNKKTIDNFVELAQWSDLIIFDYLTANLDRIVNNLFNFQWNVNIMDGPAHNLAKKIDSGLLMFLDNESGLLHGYRLLKKYNVYHSLMLENLCVFRESTVKALKRLHESKVYVKLSDVYHRKNDAVIRDILPPLPEKNAKILHERIGKVLMQVERCEIDFSKR